MNNEHETKLKILKDLKLSTIEKTEMRDSLVHFMAAHPGVQASPVSRFFSREKSILSPYTGISRHVTKVLAFSFIGLLFTGGSLTMASANSIPGELLYPIKINIQEPIEGAGKTKPAEKLEWQTKKIGRRLEEIKKLQEKKEITKEEVVIAQAVLKEHVKDLTETINTLKEDDSTKGLILSGSAELLSLSETLSTTQTTLSTAVITDSTTNETRTEKTEDVKDTVTATTEATDNMKTEDTKVETKDITTITDATGVAELKEILIHEVDKQITDIKKTVETVAQDTEKKGAESTDDKKEVQITLPKENTSTTSTTQAITLEDKKPETPITHTSTSSPKKIPTSTTSSKR